MRRPPPPRKRRSVRKPMFWSLILWGAFAALQGPINSYGLLLADRFALGVVEAVIPAMLVFPAVSAAASIRSKACRRSPGRLCSALSCGIGGYGEALRLRNVIVLCLQYALWSVGVYGFVFWLPTIVKALSDHGIGSTGALSAIPDALAMILMLANSYVSDRTRSPCRRFAWPFLLIGAVVFYLSYVVGNGSHGTSHFAGAAMGAINALGALGGFAGAYVVGALGGGTKSGVAFVFLAALLLAAALLMFLVREPQPASEPIAEPRPLHRMTSGPGRRLGASRPGH